MISRTTNSSKNKLTSISYSSKKYIDLNYKNVDLGHGNEQVTLDPLNTVPAWQTIYAFATVAPLQTIQPISST